MVHLGDCALVQRVDDVQDALSSRWHCVLVFALDELSLAFLLRLKTHRGRPSAARNQLLWNVT